MELVNMLKLGTMGFKPADIKTFSESGIDSDTVIELAKQGYKAEDVSELIKLASTEPAAPPEQTPPATKPDDAGKEPEKQSESDIDVLRKELEEQKALVINLQKQNAHKNLQGDPQPTARDRFREALKNLY